MMETNLKTTFKITRLVDDVLIPSSCELDLKLGVSSTGTTEKYLNSLRKIKFWQETILNTSFIFYPGSKIDTSFAMQLGNNIMVCPEEPLDPHLTLLLHAKLNAICDGGLVILETRFTTDISDGFSNTFRGNANDWLPSLKEWMGEVTFFPEAWWNRTDGGTFDMPFFEGDDINVKPDILIDMDEIISSMSTDTTFETKEAEIIRPTFNPKIIKDE